MWLVDGVMWSLLGASVLSYIFLKYSDYQIEENSVDSWGFEFNSRCTKQNAEAMRRCIEDSHERFMMWNERWKFYCGICIYSSYFLIGYLFVVKIFMPCFQ